jgi:hypothetical protein
MGLGYDALDKIAKRMRHSINVAQQSYLKTNFPCDTTFSKADIKPVRNPIDWLDPKKKKQPKDPRISAKAYRATEVAKDNMKEYRKEHRQELNRSKYLWMLNHEYIDSPRQSTLAKYDIEYDEQNKRYIVKINDGTPDVIVENVAMTKASTRPKEKRYAPEPYAECEKKAVVKAVVKVVEKEEHKDDDFDIVTQIEISVTELEVQGLGPTWVRLQELGYKTGAIKQWRNLQDPARLRKKSKKQEMTIEEAVADLERKGEYPSATNLRMYGFTNAQSKAWRDKNKS